MTNDKTQVIHRSYFMRDGATSVNMLHIAKIGATGFEPVTSCTPSKRANPGCATPRIVTVWDVCDFLPTGTF